MLTRTGRDNNINIETIMAGVTTHSCTKCRPIDTEIIQAYEILTNTSKLVSEQEADRVTAENDRVAAEEERTRVFNADHGTASDDHTTAQADHRTAGDDHLLAVADHGTAGDDHVIAVADHGTAGDDHTASTAATNRANDAAAAAEHMVDIHQGPQGPEGKPAVLGNNGNWWTWDEDTEQYVDTGQRAQGPTGATPNFSIGTVTTGAAGSQAAATITGTTDNPALNLTIPKGDKGDQGNTGSSVDYPYELVNNLTTNDATKGLSAQQGKVLKDELSQLEAEVTGLVNLGSWEVGSIDAPSNGHIPNYSSTTRVRMVTEKVCSKTDKYRITCNTGYLFLIYVVGKITTVTWSNSREVSLVAGDIYRIAVKTDPETSFSGYTQEQVNGVVSASGIEMKRGSIEGSIDELKVSVKNLNLQDIRFSGMNKNVYTISGKAYNYTNGTLTYIANYRLSDFIRIDDIRNARANGITVLSGKFGIVEATYLGVALFDADLTLMLSASQLANGTVYGVGDTLPANLIPSTAVYMRLCVYSQTAIELVLDGFGFDTLFFKEKDIHPTEDTLMSVSSVNPLSARQGNVLLDKLKNGWETVDVSSLTSIPMVISKTPDNGDYKWSSNRANSQYIALYRHSRIKCTKGDKFFIVANASNPFSYAWLTSYDTTYNQAAPLVAGTTPTDVASGGYIFLEAPEGAEFLYMRRSLTGVGNTELLPQTVMRIASYEKEIAVPVTLMNCIYDTTTGKIISSTSSVVRAIKVTKGDRVKFATDYTATANSGRAIYIGFSQSFPVIGTDVTIVDRSDSYAAKVTYDDYYVAPADGYMLMSSEYGTSYYTKYSFHRVLKEADAAHPLRNEKIIVFGDSILSFTDSFAGNRGFVEFLAEYTGAIVIRGSIGGTRLVPRASGAFRAFDISNLIHSWVNDDWTDVDAALVEEPSYTTIINNLKAVRPSEITAIVMDGGGNDLSNPSLSFGDETASDIFNENPTNDTLFGAINYIMRDLFTANNRLKVFWLNGLVGFAGSSVSSRTKENWVDNRSYTVDGQTYTSKEYRDKIYGQVSKWKIPLISMTDICINPITFGAFFYDNDNTHPYKGFYRMASIVASQLVAKMFQ